MKAKPTITFHIGQHKTGSKALQSFLAVNHDKLIEQGILYPVERNPQHGIRAYANSHYRLFALVRRESIAACSSRQDADVYWRHQRRFCEPFESPSSLFESLVASCDRLGSTHAILSAEDLYDMQTAHEIEFSLDVVEAGGSILARLADDFGFDPRVVIYLRRQDHLLGAHYAQYIKGSPTHDVDFEEFASLFAPRLDSWSIVSRWAAAFGRERILVRAYENSALPNGIVKDFFERILKPPIDAGWIEPPRDVESINRTMGRDFLEYIRILNRRYAQSEPVYSREDVLETALRIDPVPNLEDAISAWLSPADRRDLLSRFSEGNTAIARNLLGRVESELFAETPPEDNTFWVPYKGLTAEVAVAISLAIHETIVAGRSIAPPSSG